MDLQAAENAHKTEQTSYRKTKWKCPCNGCKKAGTVEREEIMQLLLDSGFTDAAKFLEDRK